MRFLAAIALLFGCLLFGCLTVSGQERKPQKSLDDELLKGLDNELFDGLDTGPAKPAAKQPGTPKPSALDEELLKQLDGDGDVSGDKVDPLVRLGKRMRTVEDLISRRETSSKTQQEQQQIVAELSKLIEELQKQCQGKCQSSGSSASKPNSKPGDGSNTQASRRPTESSERVEKGKAEEARVDELKAMVKDVWGHLPEKVRQQMKNPEDIRFLPKYERLIEEYYRRLAEERR